MDRSLNGSATTFFSCGFSVTSKKRIKTSSDSLFSASNLKLEILQTKFEQLTPEERVKFVDYVLEAEGIIYLDPVLTPEVEQFPVSGSDHHLSGSDAGHENGTDDEICD